MDGQQNQKHIRAIYRMLLEMANGQFVYRLPFDAVDSQFNEIALLLNEVAEKMQQAGYLNPYHDFSRQALSDIDPAILMIQKVQEYILSHIEEPLPSAKELASMFETNEFTLKDNFRKQLHTSIYQFYNDARLKKAHFMIQKTLIPLKQIAFLCGFNDYMIVVHNLKKQPLMKSRIFLSMFFSLVAITSKAQTKVLTKQQVRQDIESLIKILNENSSYVYLNGYDFNKDFENYKQNLKDSIRLEDFGSFLTRSIGRIGDRHSSVRGGEVRDSLYLPFIFAPENNKVIALSRNADKELEPFNPRYPYLKSIDGISVENFLQKILPKEISAPQKAYFTSAVRDIRDIQKNYRVLNKELPKEIKLTLSDSSFQNDTILSIVPVGRKQTLRPWDDKFESEYAIIKDEDYNKPEIVNKLFDVKDKIAYIQIPAMVGKEDAPLLFEKINSFMRFIRNDSKALIIDVRNNGGGTRDIAYEFAKYFVPPDSIFVVNANKEIRFHCQKTALKVYTAETYSHFLNWINKSRKS